MAKQSELSRVLADLDLKIAHLVAAKDAILAVQEATRTMKPRTRAKASKKGTSQAHDETVGG